MTGTAFAGDDPARLSSRNQTIGAWCGAVTATLMVIGWAVLAGWFPPPSPNVTGDALVAYWNDGTTIKLVGFVVCMCAGAFYIPFSIAVAMQLGKIGKHVRFWAYTEAGAGVFGTVFMTVPFVVFMTVAFRPDRPADVTQLLFDFGFLLALPTVGQFCVQNVAIGAAILQDRSATPLFPRWLAYYNFWLAFAYVPAVLIPFFKTGPFAWNGTLSFWVPVGLFVNWMIVMAWQSSRAIAASQLSRGQALAP